MVAKIISGKNLIGALNYNENKVVKGKAEAIAENGYAKDIGELKFYEKLLRLTDLAGRNARVKTNTVHLSLNFDPDERIDRQRLVTIASDYMKRIGFGDQPYLVYEHTDAGHPHLHILTTNICSSGERISLHNLGRTKSEEARKAIELEYGLVQADSKQHKQLERGPLQKVEYGKTDTKRAITNILSEILRSYRFTSIPELNAVLNQFNITADCGSKHSRMYQKKGLVYWMTDDRGNKLGVPIKASSIYGKPTLKALDVRFMLNEALRKPLREQLKVRIGSMITQNSTREQFRVDLQRDGIQVVFRENEEGRIYGITFVDHRSKTVFNGSDLGKEYSAAALSEKFRQTIATTSVRASETNHPNQSVFGPESEHREGFSLLEDLLKTEYTGAQDLATYKRKKKRKRFKH